MDENVPRLARELRKETCPQRVLDEVNRRISAQRTARREVHYGVSLALASLAVLCCLAVVVWRWPTGRDLERQPALVQNTALERAQAAEQAEQALGLIGSIVLHASAHSEKVILNGAVPPLRNGLETARNKIINTIQP